MFVVPLLVSDFNIYSSSLHQIVVCLKLDLGIAGKKPEGRKRLGFIKVDVADVVENRRITDTWSLMDSEQGEIQLKLEWMPLQLAEV